MASSREEIVISLKDEFSQAAKGINSAISGIKVGIAGIVGSEVIRGISESVKAFADAEQRITQLGFGLKAADQFSKENLSDYREFAEQIKRTTSFTDEQVISVERLLLQYGIYGEELKKTINVAADFATAQGIDIEAATKIFLRSLESGGSGLSRYGVRVDESKVKTQGLSAILDAAGEKFKGFAEASAGTTAGKIKKLTDAFDDLQKAVGGAAVNLGAATFLEKLANFIQPKTATDAELLA